MTTPVSTFGIPIGADMQFLRTVAEASAPGGVLDQWYSYDALHSLSLG